MRSKEFIREAGRNGSMDDFGQPINQPPTDAEYAARQAQGAKTGAAIKDFFSGTPKELKPAPANFPTIDPIARSNAGYLPATPQEIAAFQAANPYYGKVIGRDGLPINGGKVLAGGEQNVLQAAQAAAKQSQVVPGTMPVYPGRTYRDPRDYDVKPAEVKPAPPAPPAPVSQVVPGTMPVYPGRTYRDPRDYDVKPAEVKPAEVKPAEVKPAEVKPAPAAEPVPSFRVPGEAHRGQRGTTPGQNTTPPPAKFNMSPTVWSYAINMGLIQNGKPVDSAIRAFQKKNGLEVDGVIGNDTSNAILSVATPGMPNISRRGGAPAGAEREYTPFPKRVNQLGGKFPKGTPFPGPDGTTPVPALANKTVGPEFKPYTQQVKTLPTGNSATPAAAATGGYPDRITDPEGYKKEIDRRLLKKYAGNEQPAASNATPAATKEPIYRGSESGKNYVNSDQPRGAHPTNMSYDKNGKALFPMPSPFADQNAQPAPAGDSVTVKSGDTLSKIAAANGTTVQAIMAANPSITNADRISAGQTVKLRESSDLARIRHLAGLTRN